MLFRSNTTSNQQNPSHVYLTEGNFAATLTVTDITGCVQTFTISPVISVQIPMADFALNDRQNCDTLNAVFTNASQNAAGYFWTFGDGGTSTLASPTHLYLPGSYDVTLTVYNNGCFDIYTIPQAVKVDTAHVEFQQIFSGNCLPITISFVDQSVSAVSWQWSLGTTNNDSSSLQNPVFTYSQSYGLPVTLSIIDNNGCKAKTSQELPSPNVANFNTSIDSGCTPLTVHFTDISSAPGGVFWDFGDGYTSTETNPVHTYTIPGDYDVMQIAFSSAQYSNCPDTLIKHAKIKAHQPHANFSSPDLYACAPYLVHFIDSSYQADNYLWDFGDGSTSTDASPEHIYTDPGIYTEIGRAHV